VDDVKKHDDYHRGPRREVSYPARIVTTTKPWRIFLPRSCWVQPPGMQSMAEELRRQTACDLFPDSTLEER
jgi:hypothetical protein